MGGGGGGGGGGEGLYSKFYFEKKENTFATKVCVKFEFLFRYRHLLHAKL